MGVYTRIIGMIGVLYRNNKDQHMGTFIDKLGITNDQLDADYWYCHVSEYYDDKNILYSNSSWKEGEYLCVDDPMDASYLRMGKVLFSVDADTFMDFEKNIHINDFKLKQCYDKEEIRDKINELFKLSICVDDIQVMVFTRHI